MKRNRIGPVMCLVLLLMFIAPAFAEAHAYPDLTSPIRESEVEQSPQGVWIQFTEPIDTRVSQLRLETEDGQVIDGEQYSIDEVSMTLRVPPLEDGVYIVYWQVLAVDTHVTDGSFRFAVGVELPPLRPGETVLIGGEESTAAEEVRTGYNRLISVFRVTEIVTLMVLGGWMIFRHYLWGARGDRLLEQTGGGRVVKRYDLMLERTFYAGAIVIYLMTGFGHIMSRSWRLTQDSWASPVLWETGWVIASTSVLGIVCMIRPLIALCLFGFTFRKFTFNKGSGARLLGVLLLSVSFPLTGHAYHANMVIPHAIHVLAVLFWFSGLFGFVLYSFLVPKHREALQYMHERIRIFSALALAMVVLVSASGVLMSVTYVGEWAALTSTNYGGLLLWKAGGLLLIMAVASFHRFVWLPNLQKVREGEEKRKQLRYLLWGLRIELPVVLIVLILAGLLSSTSPPADLHDFQDHNH